MTRWTTNLEIELLKRYARSARFGIVEIGVMDGDTTRELARASTVPIYGIDPIIKDSMGDAIGSEEGIRNAMQGFEYRFTFYKDYSYNVVKNFTHKFDMIFIDGSHLYDDVARDFFDWHHILEKNGYVLFHDAAPTEDGRFAGWPGPTQFCKELENHIGQGWPTFVERCDTIKVFLK